MVVLYSSRAEILKHWKTVFEVDKIQMCRSEKEVTKLLSQNEKSILVLEVRQYDEIEGFLSFIKEDYPHANILLFSHKPNYAEGFSLLKFGIKAYANTYMAPVHIKDALATIQSGDVWLYPEFIQMMITEMSKQKKSLHVKSEILEKLTAREKQIALLVKEGLGNKEIALKTDITERTVKAHLSAIFEKTGITDRLSLALLV